MGCCNKSATSADISIGRYIAGTVLIGMTLVAFFLALKVIAAIKPHYARIIPLYREYARDVWDSVIRRERITVRGLGSAKIEDA